MREVFFVDGDGNMISCENIESHIGLANEIIKSDEKLSAEYEKCKGSDMVDFLIEQRGYLKVNNIHWYQTVEYYGPKTSPRQKKFILACYEQGYRILDLAGRKKQKEKEEGR